jgi:hypothetical protein
VPASSGTGELTPEPFLHGLGWTEETDLVEQSNQMHCERHEGEEFTDYLELERLHFRLK